MSEATTWREALEAAADLLMDHGVIRTGPDLERVCEQIRNLKRPVADPKKRVTRLDLDETALRSLTPKGTRAEDTVVLWLQDQGIPAVAFDRHTGRFIVARGRIQYWHDLQRNIHRFHWEELVEEVPF